MLTVVLYSFDERKEYIFICPIMLIKHVMSFGVSIYAHIFWGNFQLQQILFWGTKTRQYIARSPINVLIANECVTRNTFTRKYKFSLTMEQVRVPIPICLQTQWIKPIYNHNTTYNASFSFRRLFWDSHTTQ